MGISPKRKQTEFLVHTSNPSVWEGEAGEAGIEGQAGPHETLSYARERVWGHLEG